MMNLWAELKEEGEGDAGGRYCFIMFCKCTVCSKKCSLQIVNTLNLQIIILTNLLQVY